MAPALGACTPADWRTHVASPAWVEQYGHLIEICRRPKIEAAPTAPTAEIGADAQQLFGVVTAAADHPELARH